MEEYLNPPIKGQKKRTLPYYEIQWLIKRVSDAENNTSLETRLKQATEKAKAMFTVTSVLVLVKGGTFQMGDEYGDLEEWCRPVHKVQLTYDYYIGKYEVTFNEYDAYCEDTGKSKPGDYGLERKFRPVIYVNWNEAVHYCNWLSESEGLAKAYDSAGNLLDKNENETTDITNVEGYRLPTEAEWEYAARGGHKSTGEYKYAGSNLINTVACYNQYSSESLEVGTKSPNELGLYDMSGNVWEWCHDWYEDYLPDPQENPIGPDSASYRVLRSGSWYHDTIYSRVAYRTNTTPSKNRNRHGFRIARTLE